MWKVGSLSSTGWKLICIDPWGCIECFGNWCSWLILKLKWVEWISHTWKWNTVLDGSRLYWNEGGCQDGLSGDLTLDNSFWHCLLNTPWEWIDSIPLEGILGVRITNDCLMASLVFEVLTLALEPWWILLMTWLDGLMESWNNQMIFPPLDCCWKKIHNGV